MENIINAQLESPLGTIIYVGAGNAPNIKWLRSLSFEQLQLIEPVESIAKKLTKKYASDNVLVKNVAVSNVTGVSDFAFMHPAKYSSLKQNINLRTVLKNSRIKDVKPINTLSLSELIQNANLDKSKNNILLLSINGSELECLKSVTQEELTQFSIISVQVESKGIYSNTINKNNSESEDNNYDDNIANVKADLKEKGFYIEEIKADGAIFTNLIVKRDDAVLSKIETLIQENNAIKLKDSNLLAENETLQLTIKEQQAKNENINADFATLESELLDNIKQLTEALKQMTAETAQEKINRQEVINKHIAENETLQLTIKNQQAKNENINADFATLESELLDNNKELTEALKQLTAVTAQEKMNRQEVINKHLAEIERLQVTNKDQQEKSVNCETNTVKLESELKEKAELHNKYKQRSASLKLQLDETIEDIKQLQQAKNVNINANIVTLNAELKAKAELHHKDKQVAESLKQALDEKAQEKKQQEEVISKVNSENTAFSDKQAALMQNIMLLKEELIDKNRNASLGQKMLAKSHLDLEHLRISYSEKLVAEMALVDLVKELREKLTLASKYYYKLQQEHPELLHSLEPSNKGSNESGIQ
ncbi:MAG: hypothetical protein HRT54_06735 [Colwellia sp.]|nr:hypothetical protein [Colwellia sp.]